MVKLIVQVVSLKEARHIFLTNNIKAKNLTQTSEYLPVGGFNPIEQY